MLVAMTTLRVPGGAASKMRVCISLGSALGAALSEEGRAKWVGGKWR